MSRVVIFGASGGLGKKITELMSVNHDVMGYTSKDVDVASFKSVNNLFSNIETEVVINFAGFNFDSFLHKINESNIDKITQVINVNAAGSINIASCALNRMRDRGYGRLIFISSVLVNKVVVGTSAYSASKAFIDNLVKTASAENIGKGITCNSIQLGYFDAGLTYSIPVEVREQIKKTIPLKRWGTIGELHNTIEYLIETEYITGQNINISGGL